MFGRDRAMADHQFGSAPQRPIKMNWLPSFQDHYRTWYPCLRSYTYCCLRSYMLQHHRIFAEYEAAIPEGERQKLKDGAFEDVLRAAQEAIILPPWVALAIRPRPGVWEYVRVNVNELAVEELSIPEYLKFKIFLFHDI